MLHHTFDVSPEDPESFCWSEVYENDAALAAHLANPAVGVYLEHHAELGDRFTVEVHGTLGAELKKAVTGLPFPVQLYSTMLGYSRVVAS